VVGPIDEIVEQNPIIHNEPSYVEHSMSFATMFVLRRRRQRRSVRLRAQILPARVRVDHDDDSRAAP
jgi:hypothetical protein